MIEPKRIDWVIKQCIEYLESGVMDNYFSQRQKDNFLHELKTSNDLSYKYGIVVSIFIML